ncbi:SDR family NAD(P)-dependent oxidoreductase, partial [Pseudonocardia pini]|uniref:SDR family NAD(P)-dependent oxidoreductase n=1 Tax=Pseudonocardia pini TaxID=2758030 RepID=UPI0015F0DE3D
PAGHARIGVVSRSDSELDELRSLAASLLSGSEAEAWSHPRGIWFRASAPGEVRVAALFAGQGSQYVDMGLRAAIDLPPVGDSFDAANAGFGDVGSDTLAAAVFPPPSFADSSSEREEALRRTDYAQPAIGALAAGQFAVLRSFGLAPEGFLGHSYGELTALWAAGSLSDADFHALSRARGRAMAPPADVEGYDPGTMAAVSASREVVEEVLGGIDGVVVCNHNAPSQVVVGGSGQAVAAAVAAFGERGVSAKELPVAAAFHTSHVDHAVEAFRSAVSAVEIGEPAGLVVANSPDASYGSDVAANREVLAEQLRKPVEFVAGLERLADAGTTVFVEFGPKRVLTGLVEQTLGDRAVAIATDAGPSGDSAASVLAASVQLVVLGVPLSGLNRYVAEPFAEVAPTGMTVTLSGMTYRPESRTAAYREALTSGYTVTTPTPRESDTTPRVSDTGARESDTTARESLVGTGGPVEPLAGTIATTVAVSGAPAPLRTPDPTPVGPTAMTPAPAGDALAEHIDLHARYLDSQLRITEGLVDVLRAQGDRVDPQVHAGVRAVADSALAISRGHTHANEVLSRMTGLGGAGALATPRASGPVGPEAFTSRSGPAALAGPLAPVEPLVPAQQDPAPNGGVSNGGVSNGGVSNGGVPNGAASHSEPSALLAGPGTPTVPSDRPITEAPLAEGEGPTSSASPAAVPDGPVPNGSAGADAVRAALVAVVSEKTGYPVEMVEPGMDLEADLGIDSIKRVQILGAVAERIPGLPPVGPEQLAELRSVDDIVGVLAGEAGAVVEPERAPEPATDTRPHRFTIDLEPLPPIDRATATFAEQPVAWLVERSTSAPAALVDGLQSRGWRVTTDRPERIDAVLLLAGPHAEAEQLLSDAVLTAGASVTALRHTASTSRAAFLTVTRIDGGLGHRGTAELGLALQGGLTGLAKTLAREAPTVFARALDVAPGVDDTALADIVLAELHDPDLVAEVGVDADRARWTPVRTDRGLAGADPVEPGSTADDVVLVTGGGRGVTATCVIALAERVPAEFLLLGRTTGVDEPEPGWAEGVADADLKAALITDLRNGTGGFGPKEVEQQVAALKARREIRQTVDAVRAAGARVRYLSADVVDSEAVRTALGADAARVTTLVHGAGALADAALTDKTAEAVARVVGPKIGGLRAVLAAVETSPRVVVFGSVAGVLGNPGQADYAAANEALDRAAATLDGTALHWGAWDGGMVTPELKELFVARGVALLAPETGA